MTKVIVTFARNWRGYAAGETAGFDEKIAQALIDSGFAEEAESGRKPRKPAKPPGKPNGEPKPEPTGPAEPPIPDEKP